MLGPYKTYSDAVGAGVKKLLPMTDETRREALEKVPDGADRSHLSKIFSEFTSMLGKHLPTLDKVKAVHEVSQTHPVPCDYMYRGGLVDGHRRARIHLPL